MLSFEDAQKRCLTLPHPSESQQVLLSQAINYVTANDIHATLPQPLWNYSVMDGYAIRYEDLQSQSTFEIQEVIAAGHTPQKKLLPNQCARIMTGAMLPIGADTVIIQENTIHHKGHHKIEVIEKSKQGANIRWQGEEVQVGDLLVKAGHTFHTADAGRCAAQGLTHISIYRPLKIALITTGDELVKVGTPLTEGKIYSTHEVMLQSLIQEIGSEVVASLHTSDHEQDMRTTFQKAIDSQADVILSTGGVSVGDFDPVKGILTDLGATLDFWKVKMKPGKPIAVGRVNQKPYFALPGNPVSCMIGFLLFVRPYLRQAMGHSEDQIHLPMMQCYLNQALSKKSQRHEFMRARIVHSAEHTHVYVEVLADQSSASISTLVHADVLLSLSENITELGKGEQVNAILLPWSHKWNQLSLFNMNRR